MLFTSFFPSRAFIPPQVEIKGRLSPSGLLVNTVWLFIIMTLRWPILCLRGDFGIVVEDNGTHIRDITKEIDKRGSWPTRLNIAKKQTKTKTQKYRLEYA